MRRRIGARLRAWADRIDELGAPRRIGWSFTIEAYEGIRIREDGRGCPLWYLGSADYARAHTESDTRRIKAECGCICHKWATGVHVDGGCCSVSVPRLQEHDNEFFCPDCFSGINSSRHNEQCTRDAAGGES